MYRAARKIKWINQLNFNYIWKRKAHYIKKGIIVKDYKEGGLQAIFDCMNGMVQINWLKHFLTNNNRFWFCAPRSIFKSVGGIEILLRCDLQKLPLKLSEFHKQVLLYWKLIYKQFLKSGRRLFGLLKKFKLLEEPDV